ncbi:hypothetical protein MtrunA17_Chr8g0361711 [Medicago truncatula]|uniref:Uncharacterized protein n=1 Tax=Medicago truncatula TaxID=3880 RepID=A0A396GQT6_MEDTR|nr:hypothetical protein MtrunA17_Chr8g0361711 [Medicago truncatula]
MWFPEECNGFDPRFKLKIPVENNVDEAVFVLCDDVVRRVAQFTCDLLMSLEEGSSL